MHFRAQMELDKLQTAPLTLRGPTTTREWSRWFVMSACWPSLITLKGMHGALDPTAYRGRRHTRDGAVVRMSPGESALARPGDKYVVSRSQPVFAGWLRETRR